LKGFTKDLGFKFTTVPFWFLDLAMVCVVVFALTVALIWNCDLDFRGDSVLHCIVQVLKNDCIPERMLSCRTFSRKKYGAVESIEDPMALVSTVLFASHRQSPE
jgi:hypothetical protein